MKITLTEAQFKLNSQRSICIEQFELNQHDYWVIIGGNGSGKTLFSQILSKNLPLEQGEMDNRFQKISLISFEQQRKMVEAIFNERNNDSISPDDFGKTAKQIILEGNQNENLCEQYAEKLQILPLLDRPFIQLSTGESRKVLFCKALVNQPNLLILDEPFEGLDQKSVSEWKKLFSQIKNQTTLVLILNRLNDIPTDATHLAILNNLQIILQGKKEEIIEQETYQQLFFAENATNIPLPESASEIIQLPENQPLFELKNVNIQYGEKKILNNLSWTVEPRQNWWVKGSNGAGKSTLLSIITGDHPQSYANHVILFGKQRGSGETIWDIKKNIGYISSQLHLDYRVNCSALDVIISGFFDSIGVYQKTPESLKIKAMEWLTRINLPHLANKPFKSLSWGQQRLLLIVRAMVKYPPILILDEPFQGLDGINQKIIKHFIEQLVENSPTQLLFVSHQDSDAPNCITHLFEFVKEDDLFRYQISEVA
ncbi:molybdate ABC transporter ATP-binding protein ModF [Haemophilus paracuniculus]|uniref:Molybdate ABC transporter ATP-binding protein ModF n=1 Tax=Haemophilus paracuniculus TaxID=734 RepID=A0A1T0ARY3_9PAST|nr:molybdate ABC transporter ATP-binding protein ModF [Haemophilus paracuniculus]OOR98992.1 molybdate ABC transporter ATP-binding protein ModF [Haemophilus paracuniculus]